MSAQIITALRKRAEALDSEADATEAQDADPAAGWAIATMRMLATEFRALADTAEAP